jgi:hypothetical protein
LFTASIPLIITPAFKIVAQHSLILFIFQTIPFNAAPSLDRFSAFVTTLPFSVQLPEPLMFGPSLPLGGSYYYQS